MSRDEIRRRLEALNRTGLPSTGDAVGEAEEVGVLVGAARPRRLKAAARTQGKRPDLEATRLERLIDGHEIATPAGTCYGIARRLSRSWPPDDQIGPRLGAALGKAQARSDFGDPDLAQVAGTSPPLFLDLETCGLSGTPVFLIGCMWLADQDLHVEQLLARNYEEEPAIVARFTELSRHRPVLVTFNGKSFDWPFLRDRAAISRVPLAEVAGHCDLLHASRRHYRRMLPDCRLQTLECFVCKRRRVGDIPGGEIPAAYHTFVQSGDARQLRAIIHHNFLDLVTLAELAIDLLARGHHRH